MSKNPKHRHQTGGLQEKKVKVEPTKEEIKEEQAEIKAKRKEKRKERKKERGSFWGRMYTRLRDMFLELKKVNWPTFPQTVKKTGVVLGVVLVFGIVLFAINMGLTALFDLLTSQLEYQGDL
ncbi:MAG: preprotein translocase subunit SecE [Firmicutes bacterium]|nr:preprotein translocase subunit SecE [Bacillota bacterium]